MKTKIKGLSASDFHFGHPRVPAEIMYRNVVKTMYPHLNDELDILFIVGDFFDRLLDMSGQAGYYAALVIDELKKLAEKHQFFIRIVRGTFSHDRLQNQFFIKNAAPLMINGEQLVRLYDTIEIEHLSTLGINILYVPDDLPYEDATPVIKDKIRDAQLTQVDFALTHSYFEHLIPPGLPRKPHNTYSADTFGEFVRGVVLNGHIHTRRVYKKVVTNGSFERLCHGEEELKGFFVIRYDKETGATTHDFIVNEFATTFRTINLSRCASVPEAITKYQKKVSTLVDTDNSTYGILHIRILTDDNILRDAIVEFTKGEYENVVVTSKKATKKVTSEEDIITQVADLPIITEANLPSMISEFLLREKGVSMEAMQIQEVLHRVAS